MCSHYGYIFIFFLMHSKCSHRLFHTENRSSVGQKLCRNHTIQKCNSASLLPRHMSLISNDTVFLNLFPSVILFQFFFFFNVIVSPLKTRKLGSRVFLYFIFSTLVFISSEMMVSPQQTLIKLVPAPEPAGEAPPTPAFCPPGEKQSWQAGARATQDHMNNNASIVIPTPSETRQHTRPGRI